MDINTTIIQDKTQAPSITEMQELIFNIDQENYEDNVDSLNLKFNFNDKTFLRHFLATVGVAFQIRPIVSDLFVQLICLFSNNINNHFTPHEIYSVLCLDLSNYFLLELISNNVLTFNSISTIPRDENNTFLLYFAPEIKQSDPNKFDELVKPLLTVDVQNHLELRQKGVNESMIAELIRNDDIESFIDFASHSSDINIKIPPSIYEKCNFLNKEPSLFEYAAFYGSVKIFKYFITNKISPPHNLSFYAVAGGNFEIIHLCEQMECDFSSSINAALLFHRNEIFDYLIDQEIGFMHNSIIYCVIGYNFDHFYQLYSENTYDKNQNICEHETILLYTMKHMYSEFGIALTSLSGLDFNRTDNVHHR